MDRHHDALFIVFLIFITEFTFAACGEETESYCYYFVDEVIESESPCIVVECANVSGGIQSWTWSNGNEVSIVVDADTNKSLINNNPGFYFSRDGMSCYGISSSKEALCHVDDMSERREIHSEAVKTEKNACMKILGAGMYNGILEDICGFDGNVKEKLKSVYANKNCQNIISTEEIQQLSEEILNDTRNRFQAMGEVDFCEGNRNAYYDLAKN